MRGNNTNSISGIFFSNADCITEENCQGNVLKDKGNYNYGEGVTKPAISGYIVFFLLDTQLAASSIVSKKIKVNSKLN